MKTIISKNGTREIILDAEEKELREKYKHLKEKKDAKDISDADVKFLLLKIAKHLGII